MEEKLRNHEAGLFSGLVFWGSEFLPKDIYLTLHDIREWTIKENLIEDEFQIITPERANALRQYFSGEDGLAILIHLYKDSQGKLNYLEYPFIPIKTLIKKQKEIELIYWQLRATTIDPEGNAKEFGESRLGFLYPNVGSEEFVSMSNAKIVCQKFLEMFQKLSKYYDGKKCKEEKLVKLPDGSINKVFEETLNIEVNGDVKAKFFKTGRFFDVELTLVPKRLISEEAFLKDLQELKLPEEEKEKFIENWRKVKKEKEKFLKVLKKDFKIEER